MGKDPRGLEHSASAFHNSLRHLQVLRCRRLGGGVDFGAQAKEIKTPQVCMFPLSDSTLCLKQPGLPSVYHAPIGEQALENMHLELKSQLHHFLAGCL